MTTSFVADAQAHRDRFSKLLAQQNAIQRLDESELLKRAVQVFEQRRLTVCPVCERPVDANAVTARLRQRLVRLQELSSDFSTFRTRASQLSSSMAAAATRIEALRTAVQLLAPKEAVTRRIAELITETGNARLKVDSSARLEATCDPADISRIVTQCNELCGQLVAAATKQLDALSLTERDRSVLNLVDKGSALKHYEEEVAKQQTRLARADQLHRRAAYLFDTFCACKKAEVQAVYDAIEGDVRGFYERLHPGEPESEFRLVLAEGRRASTELQVTSFGHRVDPRALSSEGHVDSLGLCIFLAFVKHFVPPWPLVVLDDVVMSIDGTHRSRIAELLMMEFSDRQLVITTHDEIWFEELAKHQQAFGVSGRFRNLRIQRWTLEEGSVLRDHKPRRERIKEKLASADKTGAANDTRQFLEWVLTEICVRCMAPVALKRDGRYMVEDMLDPARARLRKLLPNETADVDALFAEIRAASAPGNLLSHSNANALAVSVEEVRRFSESVKALEDWFACDSCGQLPTYLQQASCIRCVNDRCSAPIERKTS